MARGSRRSDRLAGLRRLRMPDRLTGGQRRARDGQHGHQRTEERQEKGGSPHLLSSPRNRVKLIALISALACAVRPVNFASSRGGAGLRPSSAPSSADGLLELLQV